MTRGDFELEAANFFLCETRGGWSVAKQYAVLAAEGTEYIPEGVIVWEPFSNYPVTDLLNQIDRFAVILEKMYIAGKENADNL